MKASSTVFAMLCPSTNIFTFTFILLFFLSSLSSPSLFLSQFLLPVDSPTDLPANLLLNSLAILPVVSPAISPVNSSANSPANSPSISPALQSHLQAVDVKFIYLNVHPSNPLFHLFSSPPSFLPFQTPTPISRSKNGLKHSQILPGSNADGRRNRRE